MGPSSPGQQVDREISDKNPRCLGELVDTTGLRTRDRVAWNTWTTPRALWHGPEWPRRPGRPDGHSDSGPIYQRHRIDLAGNRTQARVARDS